MEEVLKYSNPDLYISHNNWQDRLWTSHINTLGRRMMIALENEFMDYYLESVKNVYKRIDELLEGKIPLENIDVKSLIRESISGIGEKVDELVDYYLPFIWLAGEKHAKDKIKPGEKKASFNKEAISYEDQKILEWIKDRKRSKIKTVTDDKVLSDLIDTAYKQFQYGLSRERTMELWDEKVEEQVRSFEEEVRETLREIYDSKSYIFQRIIRTESANAYARAALLAYRDSGIEFVVWRSVGDSKVCAKCRELEQSGRQFSVQELLDLDYPQTHFSHPNCFIDPQVPIYTSKGWKPIGKIEVGDKVLTHKGRFKKVTQLIRTPKQKPNVTKITVKPHDSKSEITLTVTDNHPILVNGVWMEASDIIRGDHVSIMASHCKHCGEKVSLNRESCKKCLHKYAAESMLSKEGNRRFVSEKASAQMKREYEFISAEVVKVERYQVKKNRMLYNFSVEDDESYVAKGIIVHNCRCVWEPVINWEPYRKWMGFVPQPEPKDTVNIEGKTNVSEVPIEFQESVRKFMKSVDSPIKEVEFHSDIVDTEEWLDAQIRIFMGEGHPEYRAVQMANSLREQLRGKVVSWNDGDVLHVSNFAAEGNLSIVESLAKDFGDIIWDNLDIEVQELWRAKWAEKISEIGKTLEKDGVEIFGDNPFITYDAKVSPEDYFRDAYAAYLTRPYVLRFVDRWAYFQLRDSVFNGREWVDGLR